MTIEEKAKAYDKTIERAKRMFSEKELNYLFPELAESVDEMAEKIRKDIISYLNNRKITSIAESSATEKWLDWLEKQGEKETTWNKEDEENMNNILYIFNQLKDTSFYKEDDIVEKTIRWFKSLKDRLCSNNEYDKDILGAIEYCIRNNRPLEKEHISWLEKQGNKQQGKTALEAAKEEKVDNQNCVKSADKVEPTFKVGDTVTVKPMSCYGKVFRGKPFKIVDIIGDNYVSDDGKTYSISLQDGWELVEQKPDDKIEPKFKVGDWVVFNNKHQSIYQVEKIEDGYYILRHTYGGTFRVCTLYDESLRLWTIQDAKSGDVLVCPKYAGDIIPNIFIFKNINIKDNDVFCYCSFLETFRIQGYIANADPINTDFYPATKEQHDLLFQMMKDAGYEWDAEKKELRKIGQNSLE